MKTKDNVQKTASRIAAVIVSLVLVSFTVTAQDFWKKVLAGSSFNQIALAVVDTNKKPEVRETAAMPDSNKPAVIQEPDSPLHVESWMVRNNHFNSKMVNIELASDKNLQIEPWMFNEEVFNPQFETESRLTIEDWMTNEQTWN